MSHRARLPLVVLLFTAVALVAGCPGTPGPQQPISGRPADSTPAASTSPLGLWREQWGIPGETDVTYHDEYEVGSRDGQLYVLPRNQEEPDEIQSVRIEGDVLDMVIHTSFDIHYVLRMDPGGASMSGTATTPDKVVPIRWDRIGP
jgi:hypothetical protein